MGGIFEDWELTPSEKGVTTVVVVGKTGNGKSATGNSILGRDAFISDFDSGGVTSTCELQSTNLEDGRTLNVIDTPGLFDGLIEPDDIGQEIVRCVNLAKDGIHAIVVVFSVTSRFTAEEWNTIGNLKSFFGDKIVDYMIIVFTGGDQFEAKGKKLNDYINRANEPLKEVIRTCKGRVMLFDNNTQDRTKKAKQVEKLVSLVDLVIKENDGKPFSNEIIEEVQKGLERMRDQVKEIETMGHTKQEIIELKEEIYKAYENQLKRVTEMIEVKLREAIVRLEKQLAEEQSARLEAEGHAREARSKSEEEINKLKEELRKAHLEAEEIKNKKCAIL